jgi:hypothetical protein
MGLQPPRNQICAYESCATCNQNRQSVSPLEPSPVAALSAGATRSYLMKDRGACPLKSSLRSMPDGC